MQQQSSIDLEPRHCAIHESDTGAGEISASGLLAIRFGISLRCMWSKCGIDIMNIDNAQVQYLKSRPMAAHFHSCHSSQDAGSMHSRNFQKFCPIFSIKYIEKNSNAVSSWRNQHTQPGRRWIKPHVNIRWIAIEYDIRETMPLTVHKMDIPLLCIRIHEYKSAAVTCQESGRKDSILACLTSP